MTFLLTDPAIGDPLYLPDAGHCHGALSRVAEKVYSRASEFHRPSSLGLPKPFVLSPLHLMVNIVSGWIHKEQHEVIDYLRTENAVLKELHGNRRILLDDNQRRRLAMKGKVLGRKRLFELGTLFTPDTILRWHRTLIAEK